MEQLKKNAQMRAASIPLLTMMPGKERRALLIEAFKNIPGAQLAVNRRGCLQLHQDPDLKKLLKKGMLVRTRSVGCPSLLKGFGSFCRQTYLELNDKKAKTKLSAKKERFYSSNQAHSLNAIGA